MISVWKFGRAKSGISRGRPSSRRQRWRRPGLSPGPWRNFMQIIGGSISASTAPPSRPRRVVVLLLRFTLLRTFPWDDPLCVLSAMENYALQPWRRRRRRRRRTPLVLFYLCLASSLPPSLPFPPRRRFPSDVFHCRPLFRLLLLTSFVRTSLQRKKGEKSARPTTGRDESEEKKGTEDRLEVSLCSLAQNKISSSMNKVDTSPK